MLNKKLKYTRTDVLLREIPGEVSLAFNISNCPYKCPGCHSTELWGDNGSELTYERLQHYIEEYGDEVTCFLFMGDGGSSDYILPYAEYIKKNAPHLKVALYTGQNSFKGNYFLHEFGKFSSLLDYVKVGPWKQELGTLTSDSTNQTLYKISIEPVKLQ